MSHPANIICVRRKGEDFESFLAYFIERVKKESFLKEYKKHLSFSTNREQSIEKSEKARERVNRAQRQRR